MTFNQQHESFLSAASGHTVAINTWPCGQRGAGSPDGIRRCYPGCRKYDLKILRAFNYNLTQHILM